MKVFEEFLEKNKSSSDKFIRFIEFKKILSVLVEKELKLKYFLARGE